MVGVVDISVATTRTILSITKLTGKLISCNIMVGSLIYVCKHQCLAYADDTVLMVGPRKELKHVFKILEEK